MTRRTLAAAFVSLCALVGSSLAHGDVGPGYFSSPNLELVRHVPLSYDSAGGRIVGDRFFITTSRDFRIYDISDPADPVLTGTMPLLQDPQFGEEDLDSNGRIALVESEGTLHVIDVAGDQPVTIGTLEVPDFHTVTCVLDCTWAYASGGEIVDLRDPRNPVLARDPLNPSQQASWGRGKPAGSGHDVTEVAPGIVVTSSTPILVLDARETPARPKLLAAGTRPDSRFIHGNIWPREGADRFLLVGGETFGPRCNTTSAGAFMVFDTQNWQTTATFKMVSEYRVGLGTPLDGQTVAAQYCAHWFTPHPSFNDGGLVAMAWYDYGLRLLRVRDNGQIVEAGYLMSLGSVASAAYWASDSIIYVADYTRGFDVVRLRY